MSKIRVGNKQNSFLNGEWAGQVSGKYGKQLFFLSHYSHQVWYGSHKGVIHLFGHSHNSIEGIGKSMDIGVDTAYKLLKEYRPFSIEEVISIMDKKEVKFTDHHKLETDI